MVAVRQTRLDRKSELLFTFWFSLAVFVACVGGVTWALIESYRTFGALPGLDLGGVLVYSPIAAAFAVAFWFVLASWRRLRRDRSAPATPAL